MGINKKFDLEKLNKKSNIELNYSKTNSSPNLKEVIINDPYKIFLKKLGKIYEDYRKKWRETGERLYVTPFPIQLDIDISDSCNLSCSYCFQKSFPGWSEINMTEEVFTKILEEATKKGVCSINLGWCAEPLVNLDNFKKFLDIMDKYPLIDRFIHTNAFNFPEEIQKKILDSKINTICFSLAEIEDETRKNKLDIIIKNIINFKRLRDLSGKNTPIIRIGIIPTKKNKDRIKDYVSFWKKYTDYIDLQDIVLLNPEEGYLQYRLPCNNPWRRLSINSKGDVYPCCSFTCFNSLLCLGNIKDSSLEEMWKSPKIKKLRNELLKEETKISGCNKCLNSLYSLNS